jgi:ribonuclease R
LKLDTPRILALWRDKPDWAPTFQELCGALKLPKAQQGALRAALDPLLADGTLEHQRHRFRLREPAAVAPLDARGPRTRPVHVARSGEEAEGLLAVFAAHPNGFGFADLTGQGTSLFIPPRDIGGALDGDIVRVARRPARGRERTTARVVEVLERRHRRVRGRLQYEYGQCWLAPFSEKLPLIFITDAAGAGPWPEGTIVEAAITAYPDHHDEAPEGRIMQVFEGEADAPEQVVMHILSDLSVSPDFTPATRAEMGRLLPERAYSLDGRQDQRKLPYVTIDGADARDFDDAVCLQPLRNGHERLLVAIADVAAYVLPGSAVDGDAQRKGTSVYFPNQVFPMLPERLSNDLCSLRPDEPRPALVCEMELERDGRRVSHRIYESVIQSQARLTYTQVQALFDGDEGGAIPKPLQAMLTRMRGLAAALRGRRDARGALDFSFPEYKFDLDRKGWPRRVREVYATEATRLIEQFMLEANETVAEHCAKHDLPILYRVHDPPPPDQINNLAITLLNFGVELKTGELARPGAIKALVSRVQAHPQREQIEVAILRSLSQAQYRARNDGHFALAAPFYTHFTSPIRRYPDLLLHRALKANLEHQRRPFQLAPDAGLHTSVCERTAAEAENRVVRLYKVLYMEGRLGEPFAATVSGLSERGLWLRLRDEPIDGLLAMGALPMAPPRYDRERNRLMPRGKGPPIVVGQRLVASLARTDRLTQQIEFGFVRWGWEGVPARAEAPAAPAAAKPAGLPASRKGAAPAADPAAAPAARKAGSRRGGRRR